MESTLIHIDGMTCNGCVKSVTGVLTALGGVESAEVSLANKSANIAFDAAAINRAALIAAVEEAGFEAR